MLLPVRRLTFAIMVDLLVLGGGVAGCAAALAARAAGARVTLLRAGPGASALASGAWRGAPPAPFLAALERADHPLVEVSHPLPHVNGFLDAARLAPPWHALGAAQLEGVAILGVRGLPTFNAAFLARPWLMGPMITGALELPQTPAAGWSPVSLAAAVERSPERVGELIGRLVRERGVTRAILPPMLGLERPLECWRAASGGAGIELAEAVGGTPSIPGWRLDRALLRALADAGVELIEARAAGGSIPSGTRRLSAVTLQDGRVLPTGALVLATGKFAGGGIEGAPALRETVLGLPVWVERLAERFHDAAPMLTTDVARADAQPLLVAGVRADGAGRPLDERGDVILENVRVAGSVRHGMEAAALGLGNAAVDGWAMGLAALEGA